MAKSMKPKKFRPIVAKMPDKIVTMLKKRSHLINQERIVDLMVRRDKALSLGPKFKVLAEGINKKIAALEKV
jgi:hypothetical protein